MTVLFICYVDLSQRTSGSSVRPYEMLNAFKAKYEDVIVLEGEQTEKSRKQKVHDCLLEIRKNKPSFCYIESPTYPIWTRADISLIHTIHKMGIPIGYFYRDFYRMFPEQFPRRKSFIGRLKDLCLDYLQWRTDQTLKCCDVVYVPSKKACGLLNYRKVKPLPPAGKDCIDNQHKFSKCGIYVGGVGGLYDAKLLLDAYQYLNAGNTEKYHLILVTRKDEWEHLVHDSKDAEWLEVHHASGEELIPLYKRASVGFVCPRKDMEYNSFAISVKTFEYMSHGLPIIAIDCAALKMIIEDGSIGMAVDSNYKLFADAIVAVLNECNNAKIRVNVCEYLRCRHTWAKRVQQIEEDLYQKR